MVQRELYSDLRAIPPIYVRLDGRAFHQVARRLELKRPFDERFSEAMIRLSQDLIGRSGLNASFAFTFSDEISLFVPHLPFRGRVEKIDSVFSSYAASALTIAFPLTEPVAFDARIVQAGGESTYEYLAWRQQEAWRNFMNASCQQVLVEEGMSSSDAADRLRGLPSAALHEMMFAHGINLSKFPAWQRRGSMIFKTGEKKEGYNPLTGEKTETDRTVLAVERDLPLFTTPEGRSFLRSLIEA